MSDQSDPATKQPLKLWHIAVFGLIVVGAFFAGEAVGGAIARYAF